MVYVSKGPRCEYASCFRGCFVLWSQILNSCNGLCFEWVSVAELHFNGLCFK
jgi:hypothetical protein